MWLRLPAGFASQLIKSETRVLELARALGNSGGHLWCGKKHELQSNFPHRYLIVLEHNNVKPL
jgi:hypothetical protein